MKAKGIILILLGILGAIFVCTFDIIAGKPVNDITGPKSISALVISGLFIIVGIRFLLKSSKK
jgi:putative Ca2+/H+ antiporter (TMEM165/GDT1 family)